jgi:hypothetical protein
MQWYYSKNNTQLGPIEQHELISKIAAGEVAASDLVWREGMLDWVPSGQLMELRSAAAAAGTPMPAPPTMGQGPLSPYAPPAAGQRLGDYGGADIPNYLWQSIVVTVFCCWPFGIPAIVFAAKVDGLKARGDLMGARSASESAKMWCLVSAGLWLLGFVMGLLLFAGGIVSSS